MKVKGNIQSIFSLNLNRVFQYSGNWFFYWQLFATWLKTIIKKSMWLIQRIFVKTKCAKVVPNLKGDFISIFQIYTICFKPITKYSRILKICLLSFLTCSQIQLICCVKANFGCITHKIIRKTQIQGLENTKLSINVCKFWAIMKAIAQNYTRLPSALGLRT